MSEHFRTVIDDDVMSVCFDTPARSVNTFTSAALDELAGIVAAIEADARRIQGVIFTSAKSDSFITGADLFELSRMDESAMRAFLERGQALFDRVSRLPMPTVAQINGHCLGGGLELSLACTWRVAADLGAINIGLPEVKLGILPGWGGTTRLTRMIGPARALPLMLAGKTLPPRRAMKLGLIDEVVRPEALHAAAQRLARQARVRPRPPWPQRLVMHVPMLMNLVARQARAQTLEKTFGHYPATDRLIDTVVTAARHGHDAGLRAERDAVMRLVETDVCENLMRLFFLRQNAKRTIRQSLHGQPVHVDHAAVIGGGTMGAGIAHALAASGVRVRLIDVSPEAISTALGHIAKLVESDRRAKRISPLKASQIMHRVRPSAQWTGLNLVDMAIEAVVEQMQVKRQVLTRLQSLMRDDAVIASNTSSLSLTEMAAALDDPSRLIGLHFFNPVDKMPLVEVVRTPLSSSRALGAGAELALRLGKTPVLVVDAPGFLVNRLLIPYLAEALTMASRGADIRAIDAAMKHWGMPMGPFELLDQVGLDIAVHILHAMRGPFGERFAAPERLDEVLQRGWLGRKTKLGFYDYRGRRATVHDALLTMIRRDDARAEPLAESAIQWRLLSPMINEAMRVLEAGVVESTDTIDLATVLGLGLAPFRGGLARFIDTTGLPRIVRRMDELAQTIGPRFAPVEALRQLAEEPRTLAEYKPGKAIESRRASRTHA